ncbi:hypothetical protein MPER_05978, partial [Moniliophthora perniciosa FA553]
MQIKKLTKKDCAFHCCVRLKRWSANKSLSFVPPDGRFTLADYSYSPSSLASASAVTPPKTVPIPFQIKPNLDTDNTGGCKRQWKGGASWTWDSRHGVLKWEIPHVSPGSTSGWGLQGSFTNSTTSRPFKDLVVRF